MLANYNVYIERYIFVDVTQFQTFLGTAIENLGSLALAVFRISLCTMVYNIF